MCESYVSGERKGEPMSIKASNWKLQCQSKQFHALSLSVLESSNSITPFVSPAIPGCDTVFFIFKRSGHVTFPVRYIAIYGGAHASL
jgi:hypothetical protein